MDDETLVRFQSLLAWVDAFQLHNPPFILYLPITTSDDGTPSPTEGLYRVLDGLKDGQLLVHILDCLTEGQVVADQPPVEVRSCLFGCC